MDYELFYRGGDRLMVIGGDADLVLMCLLYLSGGIDSFCLIWELL